MVFTKIQFSDRLMISITGLKIEETSTAVRYFREMWYCYLLGQDKCTMLLQIISQPFTIQYGVNTSEDLNLQQRS
jgi:hypothetical protein